MKNLKDSTRKRPTEEQLHIAMQTYIDALNKKDIQQIISLFADGGTIEDPVGSTIEGASAGLTRLVGALPVDATFTLDTPIRTSHDGSGAAFAMTVILNHEGKQLTIHSIDVMQFDEKGLITEMKAYYGPSNISAK
ncbi:nuclear transport factor 2 family protein [Sphingobacterium sp. MYb382]|uniref:nuclear transport factor 2 family protein n=1 Tax=Sphingobacterium sp. MYb382 TaxID=2745278 RepID=UPI0030A73F9A